MCQKVGHPVVTLRRVAFGDVTLGDLPSGRSRSLTDEEVAGLRSSVGLSSTTRTA